MGRRVEDYSDRRTGFVLPLHSMMRQVMNLMLWIDYFTLWNGLDEPSLQVVFEHAVICLEQLRSCS